MIGIDSLNLRVAKENGDRMPVLAHLLASGELRMLASSARYASASVWPTFASGESPGIHGHYFPFQWDAATMSHRRTESGRWAADFAFEPFWYRLARAGVESVAIDALQVVPTDDVPCTEVFNWSCQSSGDACSEPPELIGEIRRRFGRRPIGPEVPVPKKRRRMRAIRSSLLEATRAKGEAIRWLAGSRPWRFLLAGMFEAHRAGHNLWPEATEFGSDAEPGGMLDVYAETDRQLGRIVDEIDDGATAIVVFSLSSMETNRAQNHFLPGILERLNPLWLASRGGGARPGAKRRGANPMGALRRSVPFELQYRAAELLGETIQDWVVDRSMIGGLDWATTPAFAVSSGGEGYVRLNLRGRERDGCLDPADAPAYVEWLTAELHEIRVPATGEKLVREVVRLQEVYPGPRAHRLPDLAVQWTPATPATRVASPTIGEVEARLETGRGGNHTPESFALFAGAQPGTDVLDDLRRIEELARYAARCLGVEPASPRMAARIS